MGGPIQKHIENASPTSANERDLVSGGVMSDRIALTAMSDQATSIILSHTLPIEHFLGRISNTFIFHTKSCLPSLNPPTARDNKYDDHDVDCTQLQRVRYSSSARIRADSHYS
jgi:hypothetical protein